MEPKIQYNSRLFSIRVELPVGYCKKHERPPVDLMEKAVSKMEEIQSRGDIAVYLRYDTTLAHTWQAIRESKGNKPEDCYYVTLAGGSPILPGLTVAHATGAGSLANISIDLNASDVKSWPYEWLEIQVSSKLQELGNFGQMSSAQLLGMLLRAQSGCAVKSAPLGHEIAIDPKKLSGDKHFTILANKSRSEVAVCITDPSCLKDEDEVDRMLKVSAEAIQAIKVAGSTTRVLHDDFRRRVRDASRGPEQVGVNLPLILLTAFSFHPIGGRGERVNVSSAAKGPPLKFEFVDDKVLAIITGFEEAWYSDPELKLDGPWVRSEIQRAGIKFGVSERSINTVIEAMRRREPLDGLIVAEGLRPVPGRRPYIHPVHLDSPDGDVETVDMRELQQRNIVKAGQLIGEIRYADSPKFGKNVFGQDMPPPRGEKLNSKLGDGVEIRDECRFYAQFDGVPIIDENHIFVSKAFIHQGDVNLRTGNIKFVGPVVIKGSIDSGASVDVTGDLLVEGEIRSARVTCGGSPSVAGGIILGENGRLRVWRDLKAEFIEIPKSCVRAILSCAAL